MEITIISICFITFDECRVPAFVKVGSLFALQSLKHYPDHSGTKHNRRTFALNGYTIRTEDASYGETSSLSNSTSHHRKMHSNVIGAVRESLKSINCAINF